MDDEGSPLGPNANGGQLGSAPPAYVTRLAGVLRAIPDKDAEPKAMSELAEGVGVPGDAAADAASLVVGLLRLFDVLLVSHDSSGAELVRARNRHALYFLHSLATHLLENRTLLSGWDRGTSPDGPFLATEVLSGPQFLYLIESRRSAGRDSAPALRQTRVSQLLITARLRGAKKTAYLFQFDRKANQFQLIGGHARPGDADELFTMRREAEEELPANQFHWLGQDTIVPVADFVLTEMSRTFGVNTEYSVHFYRLRTQRNQLLLGPADRWLSESEVLNGITRFGEKVANDFFHRLRERVDVATLELSIDTTQKRHWKEVYRDRQIEILGLILAVVAILVGIVTSVVF